MAENPSRKFLASLEVEDLFGQYSYVLAPKADASSLSSLFILYGENGVGKTTILWLLNHLLSKQPKSGHRSFIARTVFKRFAVNLGDGTALVASREEARTGNFRLSFIHGQNAFHYDYEVDSDGSVPESVSDLAVHQEFSKSLPDIHVTMLADDRKITNVSISPKSATSSHQQHLIRALQKSQEDEKNPSALTPALNGFRDWARALAFEGARTGLRDANVIYTDLVKRVAQSDEEQGQIAAVLERLLVQGKLSRALGKFGLIAPIDLKPIAEVVSTTDPSRWSVVSQVIKPFLDSNEARFDALAPLQSTLTTFVDELNGSFFENKTLLFDLQRGVRIIADGKILSPEVLSSGEKQLLVACRSEFVTTDAAFGI
jgi:energy-coupling factor transporter ATP-binding protein EcfA2